MEKEDYNKLEDFRKAIAKITADREAFRNIIKAHEEQDAERFQDILKKLELMPLHCIILCRFICWIESTIRCERICKLLCPPHYKRES